MKIFQQLDDATIKELAEEMTISTYKKGDTIIEYGKIDDSYDLFIYF